MINLMNVDCMEYMKTIPDKHFDLAICDPPYGIGADKQKASISPQNGNGNRRRLQWDGNWDSEIPCNKYFTELFRVSKNQIIWGGNYFIEHLTNTKCCLIWDKVQEFNGSDFELAWTSFNSSSKLFKYARCLMHHYPDGEDRIHPTQKPIKLYKWLLKNYAKEGDKIFDSHLGSGSIAIACHDTKFDLVGCEIDKDYYEAAMKRFDNHKKQLQLW